MKAEYINPFLTAASSVFKTMLGVTLSRGQPFLKDNVLSDYEVSGVIGMSGKVKGMAVLSLSQKAALGAAGVMLGERPAEMNSDTIDAVGELTNMIAGSAKAQLAHLELNLGLPTVVRGKSHSINFPRQVTPICIPFECAWGKVCVIVGIAEA